MTSLTQNAFEAPRTPSDPDVLADLSQILAAAGHTNHLGWTQDPDMREAHLPCAPRLQRFLANRYWRRRLLSLQQPTQAERFCLMDDTDDQRMPHATYLKLFAERVAPTIVAAGL